MHRPCVMWVKHLTLEFCWCQGFLIESPKRMPARYRLCVSESQSAFPSESRSKLFRTCDLALVIWVCETCIHVIYRESIRHIHRTYYIYWKHNACIAVSTENIQNKLNIMPKLHGLKPPHLTLQLRGIPDLGKNLVQEGMPPHLHEWLNREV